jgi:hypothetical protein
MSSFKALVCAKKAILSKLYLLLNACNAIFHAERAQRLLLMGVLHAISNKEVIIK